MLVFTLPSFPYVFKVIRDRFAPPKDIDRQTVLDKYLMVKLHDRVGRMADTLEYSLVALPLERFDPALLEELQRECASTVEFDGDQLVLGHVYIERRMQPLNLHVEECRRDGDEAGCATRCASTATRSRSSPAPASSPATCCSRTSASRATTAWCSTTTTRSSRWARCTFRRIPPRARATRRSSRPSPTGASGDGDVFPEQFERFLVSDPRAREIFYEYHRDLLDPAFWARQAGARARRGAGGRLPLPEEMRFPRRCSMTHALRCAIWPRNDGHVALRHPK